MLLPDDWLARDLVDIAKLAPLQEIHMPLLQEKAIRLYVKREDMLHPLIGGNKIYKLHGFIQDYRRKNYNIPMASFGGAYSNHILALAALGASFKIPTVGVIRGEQVDSLSPTLIDAQSLGMHLHFVSRSQYRHRDSPGFAQAIERQIGHCYWIPEGGSGSLGAAGAMALGRVLADCEKAPIDAIFHACGTGSTFAGLVAGLSVSGARSKAYGIAVLKAGKQLNSAIQQQLDQFDISSASWMLLDQYHCGGYAKYPAYLADFVEKFEQRNDLLLDPVYTSKVMMAVFDLIKNNGFAPGSRLVAIHSGGLQGRRGFGLDGDGEGSVR